MKGLARSGSEKEELAAIAGKWYCCGVSKPRAMIVHGNKSLLCSNKILLVCALLHALCIFEVRQMNRYYTTHYSKYTNIVGQYNNYYMISVNYYSVNPIL